MSKTVDSRVVEMQFDNRQFESNARTSMSTLEKLKQSLNFGKSSEGLKSIDAAAKNIDMNGLANGVEAVRLKFSALQVIGVTALTNIANTAVNTGKRMIKALTIDPIKTGFQEYETKINAIQTIMSNTANKGTTMKDVTRVLDELNTYADKTIYNFAEMTRNIGTFTAAGVGLEDSAKAIQGISNLAAASGSSSQQASTAMYQLSQALATGTVKLMDWNSVVNAGMGGQKFQEALKATAREHGVAVDEIIKKNGSFRDSLQEGWLSAEILNDTLKKFTVEGAKDYAKSMVESGKWTKEQADALIKEARAMEDAATKVKTFTQLWDTLKESAQSGWSQSWEIIIGNFEEAKEFLTEISDTIGGVIGKSADTRNKVLQGWKDLGGRTAVIDALRNTFEGLVSVVKPINEAFRDIFPPITAKQLYNFSVGLRELTKSFKLSDETADKLKRTFKGLFSIFDVFKKVLTAVAKVIGSLFTSGGVSGVLDLILTITATIGDFFTELNKGFSLDSFTNIFTGISEVIGGAINGLSGFESALSGIGKSITNVVGGIWDAIKTAFSWITDNISIGDIFAGLAGGGIFVAAKKLMGLLDKLKDLTGNGLMGLIFGSGKDGGDKVKLGKQFSEVLSSVNETLSAFTNGIKVGSLVAIAAAIAILSSALETISNIRVPNITKSLAAIGIMFTMLTVSFKSINKSLSLFAGKGIVKTGIALMMMAKAIDILANAMKELSGLSFKEIVKGLIGIGGGVAALTLGLKAVNGVKINFSALLAIGIMAKAIKSLAKSLVELGAMSWKEIRRGLTAMGGALTEFMIALKVLEKVGSFKSFTGAVGLLIAVQSLDEIADALAKLGTLSWSEIKHGLTAMGGALAELGIAMTAVGKLGGFSGIIGAATIVEGAKALGDIAKAFQGFVGITWDEIKIGLVGMGGALTELAVISGLLGKLTGLSGLVGSVALVVGVQALGEIANAFQSFVGMSWNEIKMGLVAMGGALAEVGIITGALGKLAGFSGLLGAGSLLIAVQGLGDIADALMKFGSMTWDQVKIGLVAMGGALGEIALITGTLGKLGGLSSLVGSGSILIAVQGLGDIADALKKFGEMSWDEIGRGLTAMGAALGELALGGFLNTLSILGSMSISNVAEPLGVLADSVKKWSGVTVPENLGLQLALLARGIRSFTFDGLGASALATSAPAIGTMASSVKKWTGVTVPENLGEQLKTLAKGIKSFTFGGMGASALSEAAAPLGNLAKSVKKWSGVTVPENLSTQLSGLAEGIKSFTWAFMGGWSLETVVGPLEDLAKSVKKLSGVNFSAISSGLKTFASSISSLKSVSKSISGLGSSITTNIIKPINSMGPKLKGAGSKLASSLANGMKSSSAVKSTASSMVNAAAKAITSRTNAFNSAGSKLATSFANGIKSKKSAVTSAVTSMVNSATSALKGKYNSFYSAGTYLAKGFANGINSKKYLATNAARSMANAAVAITRSALRMNSPSKVFIKIGSGIPEGLAIGITKFGGAIKKSVSVMTGTALNGTKNVISRIGSIINSDIDAKPTIRPVVDLSNVKSGAEAIDGLLGNGVTVGANVNLSAINTAMNRRNQNGGNDDIISAIDKLRNELGNISQPSYNVAGITYDDGSNVADAVKSLIQAARVGRRV